ncbi:unnamed protein product [Cyprideis torosa]|uniref:Uncharacterized protein n=1 Tax=Cyprideis torosa TaxID=163714 RepID=A0A7R8W5L8_9CRUS|nr:unnamed protein product [Cyprideis torosa]CAG0885440.1 unnamed protein product [Cyprideis torosa]
MQEKERERQAALEAERQRQIEAKEAARREQERLAQLEWEKQKKTELLQMKQTQQEKVVNLKAQNQKMSIELSSLTSKIKELTEQVADTRAGIAGVKHSIDGMRTTRDSKVKAINDAKMSLKEQNQRLMNVVQEKAKLAEKSRKDGGSGIDGEEDAMAAAIQRKQATNKTLKEELETVTTENDALDKEVKSKLEELNTLKETMGECHLSAKKTYQTYLEKRQWIMDKREKEKKALYDPNAAWGASVDDTSFVNLDDRTGEEGWLQGDLENGGGSGWFPEAYAEKYDPAKHNGVAAVPEPQTVNFDAAFPPSSTEPEAPVKNESGFDSLVNHQDSFVGFQKDPFAPENAAQPTSGAPVAAEVTASEYVALYTYTSEEPGDLVFQQGQVIKVIAKDGDWWTGVLEDGSKGIFPANYVTPKEDAFADHFTAPASTANSVTPLEEPPKEEPVPPETQPAHLDGGTDEETDVSPKGVSKKILIAKVIAPYEATTKEQLSLQRGQLIQVYKKSSSGWWEGELQAKGQGRLRGWFPGTYVKVLAGSTSAVSSARTSPVPKSFLEGLGEPPLPSGKEFVVALYPYTAQHSDELSFQKGDVMKLISREEENWWRCELHGKVGLLPAVYVEITKAPQSISWPAGSDLTNGSPSPSPTFQLPASEALRNLSQTERTRQGRILELIETEEAYVHDMNLVLQVFTNPLCEQGILSDTDRLLLFVNWEDLIAANEKLLRWTCSMFGVTDWDTNSFKGFVVDDLAGEPGATETHGTDSIATGLTGALKFGNILSIVFLWLGSIDDGEAVILHFTSGYDTTMTLGTIRP